jgi:multidrug resistance efflux pump
MDVMATISALSNGLDILKTLKDIDLEFDRAKYKAQVAELMSTLAEAKISLLDAKEQIQSRDIELTNLKKAFEFARDSTVIQRGMRYQKAPDGTPEGG